MRKLLLITVVLVMSLPALAMGIEQIVLSGFSYFTPPEQVGTATTVVGFLEPPIGFDLPFSSDFVTNEYTFVVTAEIASITPLAATTEYTYVNGALAIYEDPAKNGNYGVSPPNGTAPSTFQDGTLILVGAMTGMTRLDFNFGFPEPTVIASVNFTGGSKLGELTAGGSNWTFHGGLSTNPLLGIPFGYKRAWNTKCVPPDTTPIEETTWGGIKALYGATE